MISVPLAETADLGSLETAGLGLLETAGLGLLESAGLGLLESADFGRILRLLISFRFFPFLIKQYILVPMISNETIAKMTPTMISVESSIIIINCFMIQYCNMFKTVCCFCSCANEI